MKITIDVDITPEELRSFIGLPNVEKLQQEMLNRAQQYFNETDQSQYKDLMDNAMQPILAYQGWIQKMMGGKTVDVPDDKTGKADTNE